MATLRDKLTRHASNPIIGHITGSPARQEPKVLVHPTLNELWMYYVQGFDRSVIRRATSADGDTWVDQGVALSPYIDALYFAGHHRVVYHDGTWYMFCINCGVYSAATSTDGVTWTPVTGTIAGSDPLGEDPEIPWEVMFEDGWDEEPPFNPNHWSSPMFDANGQPIWWSEAFMQEGDEPYAPSGHTRHNDYLIPLVPRAAAGNWPEEIGNTWATAEGGKWQIILEGKDGSKPYAPWRMSYFESPSFGPGLTPLAAMQQLATVSGPWTDLNADDVGVSGGPFLFRRGSTWHMFYHASTVNAATPTTIHHATAASMGGPWTPDADNPVIDIGVDISAFAAVQDQIADVNIMEFAGKVRAYWNAMANNVGAGNINQSTFEGTMAEFLDEAALTSGARFLLLGV